MGTEKMAQRFDDRFVKNAIKQLAASGKRDMTHFDKIEAGKSLLLRLTPHSATFKVLYYVSQSTPNGKQRSVAKATKLGSYPEMTVREAYLAARAFDNKRATAAATSNDTFGDIAQRWFEEKVTNRKL